jgi:serine/threonine-protein kinase RsbW
MPQPCGICIWPVTCIGDCPSRPQEESIATPSILDIQEIHKQTAIIAAICPRLSRRRSTKGTALPDSTPQSKTSPVLLTLDSSLSSVDKVEQTAGDFAARAGFDEDTVLNIAMAVREAATNAVFHGNAYDPSKQIIASFEVNTDDLIIRIADQGPGLDPAGIPDPLAPENILRGSGRGIFLIRAFMDEVHFRQLQPGTELTLIKHRAPARPAA